MKKLKQIPFNHELIGQEGIVVKYRNDLKVLEVHYFSKSTSKHCIISTDENGELWGHKITGRYAQLESELDLIMYQEVEVKEPRVIWVNIYDNVLYAAKDETMARESCAPSGETVKFIEVIEEGE